MNRIVANTLLSDQLTLTRQIGYEALAVRVGETNSLVQRALDGMDYSIETTIRWRDDTGGDVFVAGSVASADWGAPHDPLDDSFVIAKPS